jgi:hypothetical protein
VGLRAGLDDVEKRKFLTLPGLELRPLGRPARSQSLSRLLLYYSKWINNEIGNRRERGKPLDPCHSHIVTSAVLPNISSVSPNRYTALLLPVPRDSEARITVLARTSNNFLNGQVNAAGCSNITLIVGFEFLTTVVMKSSVFWDITPCSPLQVNRSFGRTYRLNLQGRK